MRESIATELGINVAVCLSEAEYLNPALKGLLLEADRRCIERRQMFLEALEEERTTLDVHATVCEVRDSLADADHRSEYTLTFGEFATGYETLKSLEADWEAWVQKRQAKLYERWNKSLSLERI